MRADAERNRQLIMAAALETFAERGAHAPLEAIAKRAGIGIGTLYRHFPTREDLLNALLEPWAAEVDAACTAVIGGGDSPRAMMVAWLREYVARVRVYRDCTISLVSAMGDPSSPMRPKCDALIDATDRVLTACSPCVRDDVDGLTVNRMAGGIAIVADLNDLPTAATSALLERVADGVLAPTPAD